MGEDKRLTCELALWYNLYRWWEAFLYPFFIITVLVLYLGVFWFLILWKSAFCMPVQFTVPVLSFQFYPVSFEVQLLVYGSCLDDTSDWV